MDLIYADDSGKDINIIDAYTLDLSYGDAENDFELKIDRASHCCQKGYMIYVDGEEYGGIVDKIKVNTKTDEITYSGPTWQGVLGRKVLSPDAGQDYLIVDGEANSVLQELIDRLDLADLFIADTIDSGIQIHYQFERYVTGYNGIRDMLRDAGAKLKLLWSDKKVVVHAEYIHDYSQDEEFDTSQVDFEVSRNYSPANHIICLGQGDLADRAVIHIFADENGGIQPYAASDTPLKDSDYITNESKKVMTGSAEIIEVLDISNAEITYNYILQTQRPSDWATKYTDYYYQDGDNYKNVQGEEIGYILTRYQPSDWSSNFNEYYSRSGDTYSKVSGTTTYTVQTQRPSDWATKYDDYYIASGREYKTVESVVTEKYIKQTRKPSDWSKNYGNYYVFYTDGVTTEYKNVDGISRNRYHLQTRKPSDWDASYTSYYKRKKTGGYEQLKESEDKKRPVWKAKTYYTQETYQVAPKWNAAVRYTYNKTEKAPTWKTGTYYTKSEGVAPTWKTGTYYTKSTDKTAPRWTSKMYYTKVADRYATMVAQAVQKIQDANNADTLKIDLEETEQTYDIGDIVGAIESVTGISTTQEVTQKIVKINNDEVTITYEVN